MSITPADIQAKKAEITAEGAFFEVEERQMAGQSCRAYKHAPANVIEILNNARNHGDIDFLVYEGRRYTYTGFFAQVDALAAVLQSDYGVSKGDRLAIAMRNNPEWAISYAAAVAIETFL